MKKRFALIAAASLAVGGWSFAQQAQPGAADQNQAGQTPAAGQVGQPSQQRTGQADRLQHPQQNEIHESLAEITSAVLSKEGDGLQKLSEHVSQSDRDRLQQARDQDRQGLQETVKSFHEAWKEKYNKDFDIKQDQMVFSGANIRILGGGIGEEARPAGERMPGSDQQRTTPGSDQQQRTTPGADSQQRSQDSTPRPGMTGQAGQAGAQAQTDQDRSAAGSDSAQAARPGQADRATDSGSDIGGAARPAAERTGGAMSGMQNRAMLMITAENDLPAVTLSLVKEQDKWVLDLPATLTADQLRTNLNEHVRKLVDSKDRWPQSETEAYRLVTHHVLAAFSSTQGSGIGQPGARPGQQPGGQTDNQDQNR